MSDDGCVGVMKAVESYVKAMFDVHIAGHNLMVELEECVRDHEKGKMVADRLVIYECELQGVCDMFPVIWESKDNDVLEALNVMNVIR